MNFNMSKYAGGLTTLFVALFVTLFCNSALIAGEGKSLPKDEFQKFIKLNQSEPGNLATDKELIRKLSNKQLHQMVDSFNVGNFGFLYPTKIKGNEIPEIVGRKISELSLMSVWGGKLKPIPFQFDEFDEKHHYIYIPDVSKDDVDGTFEVVDELDELIFMYRDSSEKKYNPKTMGLKEGKVIKELKFTDNKGRVRYTYVVENNSQRNAADYMNADLEKGLVTSSFYRMEYNVKNFLEVYDVRPFLGTASDAPVLDTIYFKLSTGVFSRFLKVSLNSKDNVRVKILGFKDGAVRATALAKITIVLVGGKVPVFSMNTEISFYEQGMVLPNRTEPGKGAIFVKIFKDTEVVLYADMNGVQGGRMSAEAFVDDEGNRIYGDIDGKMDEIETTALSSGKAGDWTWIESGLGWDFFMAFKIPMELLEPMTMNVYYEDDLAATTKGENFPGAGPKVGMRLRGLPKNMKAIEKLDMEYSLWFPDTVGKDPDSFYYDTVHRPQLEVGSQQLVVNK